MQNFTFGRKGLNWFLFAFILFVGSASSYGQCYTVNDEDGTTSENEQTYCYLETIQDLIDEGVTDSDGDTAIFESGDTVNDTDPIDENELLTNGVTYYVGSSFNDSCARVAVEVTVESADTPTNTVTNSTDGFTVTPCESSNFSGDDLLGLFETAPAGYSLEIYNDQFGDSEISDYSADLTDGNSYFVGFAPNDPTTDCPSERVAVGIDVVDAPAPTATSPQTFCEGATVGDLVATSEEENFRAFRWYRSATSSTPLADDVALVDGEDYFVSQIVNERSSIFPPCESDRTQVIVEVITFDAGGPVNSEICRGDLQDLIDGSASASAILSMFIDPPRPGLFEDNSITFDPSLGSIVNDFQNGVSPLEFTGTFITPEGCSDDVEFSIDVIEDPDAGEDGAVTLNSSDDPINLFDYLNGTPDSGGMWSPGDGTFDPATDTPGDYTYTVDNGTCSDSAVVTVIIEDCTITAGDDNLGNIFCRDDITLPASTNEVRAVLAALLSDDATTGGTFSDLSSIRSRINAGESGPFESTYTVGAGTSCEDSADISGSIVDNTVANAGDFDPITISCTSADLLDLSSLINNDSDATSGGTFSGSGVTDNIFDPSIGTGTYTITYSVDETIPCVSGNDLTTFDISVENDGVDAGENGSVTLSTTDDPVNLFDYLNGTPDTGGMWSPGDGTFDPATDTPGDFVYTVDNGTCSDSATVTVIIDDCTITAGDDSLGNILCRDEVVLPASADEVRAVFRTFLDDGATTGGTFSNIASIRDRVNAGESGPFETTYTVGAGTACEDTAVISGSIVDNAIANAGDFDDIPAVCSNEEPIDLTALENNDPDATVGGTFSGTGVSGNMFNPSEGAGTYTITYSVDDSIPCIEGNDSTTFEITVEDAPISANVSRTLCVTDAQTLLVDESALTVFLNDLLDEAGVEDVSDTGFDMTDLAEGQALLAFVDNPTSDSEIFNFSYVNESATTVCDDGIVNISITINNELDAEAGTIENQNVCETDGMVDLTMYLGSESISGGTFSGIGVSGNMFDSSLEVLEDGYEITYTVDDTVDCVADGTTDSETFTIFINDSVDAGDDNSGDVCRANIDDIFPNNASVRGYYLNLLSDGVPENGTFNPSIDQLIIDYNSNPEQDEFTTTYTITNGGCSDSVDLTINIYDEIPAEIGDITDPDPVCRNAEDLDLFSILPADANPNGTFVGYDSGVFSPSMEGAGTFNITYELTDDSPCTDGTASADFTITVTEAAYAGMDVTVPEACTNDTEVDLNGSISADADAGGVFTLDSTGDVITDGILDISEFASGDYTITYTVAEINDCGDDDATLTLTVSEAPDGPTVDGDPFIFCAEDDPTVAELSATGSNLTFYSDEALSMMVMAEDVLTSGTYYVTQRAEEGGCESIATAFTVTVNDADTPTISDTTLEFCDFEDPTIADLSAEIIESGSITWYDSADGDADLSEGTPLQDGTTYYAALTDADSGCESSVRLAVTVVLETCPVVVPEGFSPNGDQLNDTFDIKYIEEVYPNYTIVIHNRYGDVVYKGNANTPDWDGYSSESAFGDNILPVGAYFYYLDYRDGSTEPVRGTVYLSR